MSFLFNLFSGSQPAEEESSEELDSSSETEQDQSDSQEVHTRPSGSTLTHEGMRKAKRQRKNNVGDNSPVMKGFSMQHTQAPIQHMQTWPVKRYEPSLGVQEPYTNNNSVSQPNQPYSDIMSPVRGQQHYPMSNFMQNSNAFSPRMMQQESNAAYLSPPRFSRETEQRRQVYDPRLSSPNRSQELALNPYQSPHYQSESVHSSFPMFQKMEESNYQSPHSSPARDNNSTRMNYHKKPAWPVIDRDRNESDESGDFASSSQASLDNEEQAEKDNKCAFCKMGKEGGEQVLGPYSKVGSSRKYYVHETCARWCPDLKEFSQSTLYPPPRRFNVLLIKAITRSSALKCAYCREKGAGIGCIDHKCKHSYHLPCAMKDGAAFVRIENFLQKQKIVPFLCGIYCRDCSPFHQHTPSTPNHPMNVYKMLQNNHFKPEEMKEMARTLLIVDKVVNEREGKKKKEVEVKFFGGNYSQWVQVEDVPDSLLRQRHSKMKKRSPLYNATSEEDNNEEEEEEEEEEADDEICDICKGEKSTNRNPIIYCDGKGCEVSVHKRCYGISSIPKGKWLCYRCAAQAPLNTRCSRCNSTKASQAMTCKFSEWVHVTCLNEDRKFQVAKGSSFSSVKTRRALQMARITPRDRQDIWEIILREETHVKCPVCRINHIKKEGSFQCAHIDATAKGKGKTAQEEIWNMVPSCAKCNLTCNTKNLMDFMDDSIMMRPHIKPLLFLKVKSIIRSQMECCPLSIKDILSEKNFVTVVAKLYNPKKMTSIARLLKLSSEEHHNMFVEPDEPAPEHFYNKFLSK